MINPNRTIRPPLVAVLALVAGCGGGAGDTSPREPPASSSVPQIIFKGLPLEEADGEIVSVMYSDDSDSGLDTAVACEKVVAVAKTVVPSLV